MNVWEEYEQRKGMIAWRIQRGEDLDYAVEVRKLAAELEI